MRERLCSRLTASDFFLMAERSTVLYVPSGHTYLNRKTGFSTPPLHTPRQHYTHQHTHTHMTQTLRYCGLKSLGGNTPCHRATIDTHIYTHKQYIFIQPLLQSYTHSQILNPNLLWLTVMVEAVFIWNLVICVWVLQQNFCSLMAAKLRCISPLVHLTVANWRRLPETSSEITWCFEHRCESETIIYISVLLGQFLSTSVVFSLSLLSSTLSLH